MEYRYKENGKLVHDLTKAMATNGTNKMNLESENLNEPQNQPLLIADGSFKFKFANQTGRLMFQFDNDEPQEFAAIYDYGKFTIEIQQQKESDNNFRQNTASIEFISKDGKKFRLFIENCH